MRKVLLVMLGGALLVAEGGGMARAQEVQPDSGQNPVVRSAKELTSTPESRKKPVLDGEIYRHDQETARESWLFKATSDFAGDQREIWTSPAKLRLSDSEWLLPLGGAMAAQFATDASFNRSLSAAPSTIRHYKTLSNAGVAALAGGAGAMWLFGRVSHNPHWRETGRLAGEAALNSLVITEGMKYALGRERPLAGDGSGNFRSGGTSFPSEHAAAAWSIAGVITHEYPGPLTKIMAYGLASLVTFSRVKGQQHFPSDVLAGTIIGNLIAQNIYSRRHDPELGGGEWLSFGQMVRNRDHTPGNQGSPYVPLDSWVYPAMDRLAGLGVIETGFSGMRPWTRSECRRVLEQGELRVRDGAGGDEGELLYDELEREFAPDAGLATGEEDNRVQVESIYGRVTNISGQPLTDGNHFGQTITNDFGRPYQRGFNSVEGFSAWASSGRIVAYVRAEYQHSPSAPPLADSARQFIASVDGIPLGPDATSPAVNRAELLDAYVGMNFENWQVTYGRQSLWWSPMHGGPLMFSDNAAPVNMFRINRVSPFKLPWILGWLGEIRAEWFLGQPAGHQFVFQTNTGRVGVLGVPLSRQPFLQGQKLSFKPTPNFEFSISSTTVFSGGPSPLTTETFFRSYSFGNALRPGGPADPGDRRSGFDWTYRIPRLRDRLTFYGDAFTEDEFSPLGYPRKAAFEVGLYLSRIPGLAKMDFRVEGGTTVPVHFPGCIGCYYINPRYPDGSYVNDGALLGSSLGRAGYGQQAWSTYHLSARSSIQLSYRHQKVDGSYLPSGGTLNDAGISVSLQVRPSLAFSASAQYEQWNYPLLSPTAQSNVTSSIGLVFSPRNWNLSRARE